ncbi:MAG: DUF3562 domain-containing protein [Betaproteobacteria bacterium]|nr:DUF3562 domain-containing protein [Betaproteobacteria bacterium]
MKGQNLIDGRIMHGQHLQHAHQELAVEFLAQQSHVSIDEVTRLYASECSRLQVGAHILGFLPILAIRNVREMLHQRKAANRATEP